MAYNRMVQPDRNEDPLTLEASVKSWNDAYC